MDRILSARVDDAVYHKIGDMSRHLRISKKAVIERAVVLYEEHCLKEAGTDVFSQTSGAWKRREPARETVANSRVMFNRSMGRHWR